MGKKKPVTWNGVTYPSNEEAAAALGISIGAMSIRLSKGYTCDDDMSDRGTPQSVLVFGVEHDSLSEAAIACNVAQSTVTYWIKTGHAIALADSTPSDIVQHLSNLEANLVNQRDVINRQLKTVRRKLNELKDAS